MEDKIIAVQEIFRLMPEKFRRGAVTKSSVYHFVIDDMNWTVTLSADQCQVQEGVLSGQADCYLKTSAEIFLGTIQGTYIPSMKDLMNGKIKVTRPELLLAFKEAFKDAL